MKDTVLFKYDKIVLKNLYRFLQFTSLLVFMLLLALFAPKLVNIRGTIGRIPKSTIFSFDNSNLSFFKKVLQQRITLPLIIDQFVRKKHQKKHKDFKLLQKFFQKYFVVHERSAVKNLFSTIYVQYILILYPGRFILIAFVFQ